MTAGFGFLKQQQAPHYLAQYGWDAAKPNPQD
jgi:hypothetical protein